MRAWPVVPYWALLCLLTARWLQLSCHAVTPSSTKLNLDHIRSSTQSPENSGQFASAEAWAEARLAELILSSTEPPGNVTSTSPPAWVDREKLARYRELHRLYWPAINNAQVMSLFLSLARAENVMPLLFTGRSHTPAAARRRYLETALHVNAWALGDLWDPEDRAFQSAEMVRAMHGAVGRQLDCRNLTAVTGPGIVPPRIATAPEPGIVTGSEPVTPTGSEPGTPTEPEPVTTAGSEPGTPAGSEPGTPAGSEPGSGVCPARAISQRGMAMTQWFFVGLVTLHPGKFGLGHLSDDDLEAFLHHWRSVGHRLGVSDRNNLCAGSLSQVRALCRLIEERYLVPSLLQPDPQWRRMTAALFGGLGQVFSQCRHDAWLYYLFTDVLGLESRELYENLSWGDSLRYFLLREVYQRANGNKGLHGLIREKSKAEFMEGAEKEELPEYLTYVFEML